MRKLTKEETEARKLIKQVISDYRTQIEAITLVRDDMDCDPIMLDGTTSTGHYCQMMVDPKDVAPTLLKYDYPVFVALDEEPPHQMWRELAIRFGLNNVSSIDL